MRLSIVMLAISLTFANNLYAGECGIGKIINYVEGGWDQDNLIIKLDTKLPNQHPDTFWTNDYVRFERARLGDSRYNGMRSALLSAFMAGKTIRIYTHTNRCDSATEVTVYTN
jgi:hypothetical protein